MEENKDTLDLGFANSIYSVKRAAAFRKSSIVPGRRRTSPYGF